MDWNGAIEWNSAALKRIVATLVAMSGVSAAPTSPSRGEVAARSDAGGGDTLSDRPTLPRRLHRAILRLLRPAESAVRRLIVIAARGLVVEPSPPPRPRKPKPRSIFTRSRAHTGIYVPPGTPLPGHVPHPAPRSTVLPLLDPLQYPFRRRRPTQLCAPRISSSGVFSKLSPVKVRRPPMPGDPLDATRLTLRLQALTAALDDLPKQARRFARWQANRARDKAHDAAAGPSKTTTRRHRRTRPLRPGRPPGSLRRPDHEVQRILGDLHSLAFDVLEHPDTS